MWRMECFSSLAGQTLGRHSGAPPISGLPEIGIQMSKSATADWMAASPSGRPGMT
jgi:hypothetical protein